MKIACFFNQSPGTIGEYLQRALSSLGHQADRLNTAEADQCQGAYDLYLRIDHGDYAHDLPNRFRPRAFFISDTHLAHSWKHIRRQAARYDIVFCTQRSAVQRLPRAHWIPFGCDPEIHGRCGDPPARYDIAFVGTDGGVPRKLYLQELRERYPNSFIGRAPHTDMARIYSEAKIGFHYLECTSPLKDQMSMRVYEVLASGAMLLANDLPHQTFEAVGFQDRRELVRYRSPQELFDLLQYYLAHEAEREAIARAGQQSVTAHHTYRHRAEQMMTLLRQELGL